MTTPDRWTQKKQHYQDQAVVDGYDDYRFKRGRGRRSTERKWQAILKGVGPGFDGVRTVLDVPCGTGRFTRQLLEAGKHLVNGDISLPMLRAADNVGRATHEAGTNKGALIGGVRFDAERLPFPDNSIDLVMSIRFLFHVPREVRVRIMRELGRVSKRYLVIDVRHRYTITTHTKRLSAFLRGKRTPSERYSMKQLAEDLEAAGLKEKSRVFISPMFSEKLVVVCEK